MKRIIIVGTLGVATFVAGLWFSGSLRSKPRAASIQASDTPSTAAESDIAQEDDPKAILRQAIEAHGGAANWDKFKASQTKLKGYYFIRGVKCDVIGEEVHQRPDKMKQVLTIKGNGKQITFTTVANGTKMWLALGGIARAINDRKVFNSIRREMLAAQSPGSFMDFLNSPYELSMHGPCQVNGKDAVGIRVHNKSQKDILFYFDKKTHLMVKIQLPVLDTDLGREFTQEIYLFDYQEMHGMTVPNRCELLKDGKIFANVESVSFTPLERLDDSVFARP